MHEKNITTYAQTQQNKNFAVKTFFYIGINSKLIKTAEIIGLGALGLLVFGFTRKIQGAGTLNFLPNKVDSLAWDGTTPVLTVSVSVQNTSNQSYLISSIVGSIYSNTIKISDISFFQPFTSQPNSNMLVSVDARLFALQIVNDIIRSFSSGSFTQNIRFIGYANVDGYQLPLDISYTLGVTQPQTA